MRRPPMKLAGFARTSCGSHFETNFSSRSKGRSIPQVYGAAEVVSSTKRIKLTHCRALRSLAGRLTSGYSDQQIAAEDEVRPACLEKGSWSLRPF